MIGGLHSFYVLIDRRRVLLEVPQKLKLRGRGTDQEDMLGAREDMGDIGEEAMQVVGMVVPGGRPLRVAVSMGGLALSRSPRRTSPPRRERPVLRGDRSTPRYQHESSSGLLRASPRVVVSSVHQAGHRGVRHSEELHARARAQALRLAACLAPRAACVFGAACTDSAMVAGYRGRPLWAHDCDATRPRLPRPACTIAECSASWLEWCRPTRSRSRSYWRWPSS